MNESSLSRPWRSDDKDEHIIDNDDVESVRSEVTFVSGCTNSKALQDAFPGIDFYMNLLFKLLNVYVMIALATAVLIIFALNKTTVWNHDSLKKNHGFYFILFLIKSEYWYPNQILSVLINLNFAIGFIP